MPSGAFFRINIPMNLFTYFKETKAELKEVTFPSIPQTITYTILVVALSIIVALLLGGVDIGFKTLLAKLIGH
jgi:preprotein translocase SecE subunit